MSFFTHFDVNLLLLVAVIALSTTLSFVAVIHLCVRCYLCPRRSRGDSGPVVTGFFPNPLEYPPDDYYSLQALGGSGSSSAAANSLDAEALRTLPMFTWESDKHQARGQDGAPGEPVWCAICLGQMVDGELGRLLPTCHHVFHVDCIDKWFWISKTCPICRTPAEAAPDAHALR